MRYKPKQDSTGPLKTSLNKKTEKQGITLTKEADNLNSDCAI